MNNLEKPKYCEEVKIYLEQQCKKITNLFHTDDQMVVAWKIFIAGIEYGKSNKLPPLEEIKDLGSKIRSLIKGKDSDKIQAYLEKQCIKIENFHYCVGQMPATQEVFEAGIEYGKLGKLPALEEDKR